MFKDNLVVLLAKRRLSQRQFAALVGVTAQSVNAWVNGTKYPRMSMMVRIAETLGCTLTELTGDEKSPTKTDLMKIVDEMTETELWELLRYGKFLMSER